jgi:hypothetical protein
MRWVIYIDSLKCNDAKKLKDDPYIKVNNIQRWVGHDVKTGQMRRVDWHGEYGIPGVYDAGIVAGIELWLDEKHDVQIPHVPRLPWVTSNPQMIVNEDTLRYLEGHWPDPDINVYPLDETFRMGLGLSDARYTLYCRISRLDPLPVD